MNRRNGKHVYPQQLRHKQLRSKWPHTLAVFSKNKHEKTIREEIRMNFINKSFNTPLNIFRSYMRNDHALVVLFVYICIFTSYCGYRTKTFRQLKTIVLKLRIQFDYTNCFPWSEIALKISILSFASRLTSTLVQPYIHATSPPTKCSEKVSQNSL